ncbi:MAG: RelA/SpoT family protein [Mahellales bacterium]|jgi:guanosine-3',5'-bis(diphosphate) 3'-pyrophosphohydrolase
MLKKFMIRVRQYYSEEEGQLIEKAYLFAEDAHKNQYRISGEPYIKHPTEVAEILLDLGLDANAISAGLLHDVIEDTSVSFDDIKREFNQEVAELVDGVTKLGKFEYTTKEEQQAENLRKMFLAMAKDIRVILIKLADRLHNMRTLKHIEINKQREKANETLEIYAPLAHRLGIFKIKWELEDLALRFINPEGYYELVEKVAKKRQEREEYIASVIKILRGKLNEIGIKAEIEGRPKHFYSIYKKMYHQNKNFEQIYDLIAVRVIVNSVKDCYGILGIIHTLWKPIPGRFKDYIAVPKPNMYQSLHTTVFGPQGEPFEIQIRTREMHRTAEYGIAAHWKYKEGIETNDDFDVKLAWLRQLLEWQNDLKDAKEFVETLKLDLFTDQVFVFTPKGDVINLPQGSTPLDFAYAIHSAVGNRCIGAKVNSKIVTLDYQLKTGEIVEILTSTADHGPSRDWLKIVKTSQAKNKIKQWFKKERKEENIVKGRDMLEKEAKRQGYSLSKLTKPEWMEMVYKKYSFHSVDDVYAAVGYGGLTTNQVLTKLIDEYRKVHDKPVDRDRQTKTDKLPQRSKSLCHGVIVKGINNIMVRFSKCCNPVPGDQIIGYITRGRGVSIHRKDCNNIKDGFFEEERLIEVEWEANNSASYKTEIQIIATDKYELLSEINKLINDMKISVTAVNAKTNKDNTAIINLTVEITNTEQLEKIMAQFKKLPEIKEVYRVHS